MTGAFWGRRAGCFHLRKMPVLAIMYMKIQALIGNAKDWP